MSITSPGWARLSLAALAVSLCPAWANTSQPRAEDPAKKLELLVERFEQKQNEFYKAMRGAKTSEEQSAAMAMRPGNEFLLEFRDLALAAKGSETAAKSWMWVVQLGPQMANYELAKQAADTLLAEHLKSEALVELSGHLRDALGKEAEQGLRKLAEGSPHKKVKGGALFHLATMLWEKVEPDASMLWKEGDPESAERKEARSIFEQIVKSYADVEQYPGRTYGAAAQGFLFEADHLQIGMAAPDFSTVDQDGQKFKLSDYRGKVVVVDFWGLW